MKQFRVIASVLCAMVFWFIAGVDLVNHNWIEFVFNLLVMLFFLHDAFDSQPTRKS